MAKSHGQGIVCVLLLVLLALVLLVLLVLLHGAPFGMEKAQTVNDLSKIAPFVRMPCVRSVCTVQQQQQHQN